MSRRTITAALAGMALTLPLVAAAPAAFAGASVGVAISNDGGNAVVAEAIAQASRVDASGSALQHYEVSTPGKDCGYDSPGRPDLVGGLNLPAASADWGRVSLPGGEVSYVCSFSLTDQSDIYLDRFMVEGASGDMYPVAGEFAARVTKRPGRQPVLTDVVFTSDAGILNDAFLSTGSGGDTYTLNIDLSFVDPEEGAKDLVSKLDEVTLADCTIFGTPGDDLITGTSRDDIICGLGGDDVIYGKGGDDIILAGTGSDIVYGGKGRDTISGGRGHDMLHGGGGKDFLRGGSGDDALVPNKARGSVEVVSGSAAATDGTVIVVEDVNGDGVIGRDRDIQGLIAEFS